MANIALVEDSPAMAKLIELKLKAQGHDITHYPDGQLGLQGVTDNPPEILVLDVDLPYISGFEVAQRIRDTEAIETLPILMLTGRSDVQSRVKGLEYADDYLNKPFSPDELMARIKALLRRSNFSSQTVSANKSSAVPKQVRQVKALAGETIGQYTDLVEIGKGGMSIVYKAMDTALNRYVGLKFFTDLTENQEMKERFMREAETAATLNHGNICNVYTIGETQEGYPFMVMPFLDGENLEERLRKGPIKFEQSINYIRQIARGLANAHDQGIVHRDVKPANIFITKQGTVKLLDFGVALLQRSAHNQKLTQPGSMLGTISYMAPEQILSLDVDARADIWSLGAIIFEMLSGAQPFPDKGNMMASINAIVHEPLPQIEDYIPMVKPGIKRILDKTLCKDPNERYKSTIEILKDLDGVYENLIGQKNESKTVSDAIADKSTFHDYSEIPASFEDMPMIE